MRIKNTAYALILNTQSRIRNLIITHKPLHDKLTDRLMIVEILREQGRFDQAKALLDFSFDPRYKLAVNIQKRLIEERSIELVKLRT